MSIWESPDRGDDDAQSFLGTCWSSSGRSRLHPLSRPCSPRNPIASVLAVELATKQPSAQSLRWLEPRTNTRSQPNLRPRGQPVSGAPQLIRRQRFGALYWR